MLAAGIRDSPSHSSSSRQCLGDNNGEDDAVDGAAAVGSPDANAPLLLMASPTPGVSTSPPPPPPLTATLLPYYKKDGHALEYRA